MQYENGNSGILHVKFLSPIASFGDFVLSQTTVGLVCSKVQKKNDFDRINLEISNVVKMCV